MKQPVLPVDGEAHTEDDTCVIEAWKDGATALVDCGSDNAEVVRLVGIGAAATGDDEVSRARARRQAELWKLPYEAVLKCGEAATARAKEICPEGSPVILIGEDVDRDEHRLAYVRCAGLNVNVRMLDEGHAGHHALPADPARPRRCHV